MKPPADNPAGARPLSVLCVDDNPLIAVALQRRLEQEPGLTWAGVVSDGARAYDDITRLKPDIVLMDIDMPNTDSFAIVERLAGEQPHIKAIMFSGYVSRAYIDRALDCGAWGYLSKNDDVAKLLDAIKRVVEGDLVFSDEVETVRRGP